VVLRLILLGSPGSGKGTQARMLQEGYQIVHVSTGDILRRAIQAQTELGRLAQSYMDDGNLVPDDVMLRLVKETLDAPRYEAGYVLDGFPRTVPQSTAFESMLLQWGAALTAVISLEVNREVLIHRLSGRRVCPECATTYHIDQLDPSGELRCTRDGALLVQRKDDDAQAVAIRFDAFERETLPLKQFYRDRGLLREIDGSRATGEVFKDIQRILA